VLLLLLLQLELLLLQLDLLLLQIDLILGIANRSSVESSDTGSSCGTLKRMTALAANDASERRTAESAKGGSVGCVLAVRIGFAGRKVQRKRCCRQDCKHILFHSLRGGGWIWM